MCVCVSLCVCECSFYCASAGELCFARVVVCFDITIDSEAGWRCFVVVCVCVCWCV